MSLSFTIVFANNGFKGKQIDIFEKKGYFGSISEPKIKREKETKQI